MQPALNDLDCILERQRNDGTLDFYVEKAAEEALAYAQEVESKELAAFFAYQALVDYSRQSIVSPEVESTVVMAVSCLVTLLEQQIDGKMPPFFVAEPYTGQAELLLGKLIKDENFLAKIQSEEIKMLFKRAYALLHMLSNSGYMTERFKEGCVLLGQLKDPETRSALSKLTQAAQIYLALSKKDLQHKLLIICSIAFIALQQRNYQYAINVLGKNREMAKNDLKGYALFSATTIQRKILRRRFLPLPKPK